MNQRTIYLLIAAGVVGLVYFADQGYRSYVEKPAAEREKELKKIRSGIKKAKDILAEKKNIEKQLQAYERMSLPFNPETTLAAYKGWLLSQIKSAGLSGTTIDAANPRAVRIKRQSPKRNQPKEKTVLYRYAYSVRCRGSLAQVVSFLYRFHTSGNLHKLRSITFSPSSGGALIDTSMEIEALAMTRTDRDNELTKEQVRRLKSTELNHYLAIARRNIFSSTGSSPLSRVRITGITFGSTGRPQVWIRMGTDGPTRVFENDEKFDVESHTLEVLDIQSELVLLLVDGSPVRVRLGEPVLPPSTIGGDSPGKSLEPESAPSSTSPKKDATEKSID